jgi:hypothetical protein
MASDRTGEKTREDEARRGDGGAHLQASSSKSSAKDADLPSIRNHPDSLLLGEREMNGQWVGEHLPSCHHRGSLGAAPSSGVAQNRQPRGRTIIGDRRAGIVLEESLPGFGACRLDSQSLKLSEVVQGQRGIEAVQGFLDQRGLFERLIPGGCSRNSRCYVTAWSLCDVWRGGCDDAGYRSQRDRLGIRFHLSLRFCPPGN